MCTGKIETHKTLSHVTKMYMITFFLFISLYLLQARYLRKSSHTQTLYTNSEIMFDWVCLLNNN